jgi:hypothetical protein
VNEEALRAIIASAPTASDWLQTPYDAALDESASSTYLRFNTSGMRWNSR